MRGKIGILTICILMAGGYFSRTLAQAGAQAVMHVRARVVAATAVSTSHAPGLKLKATVMQADSALFSVSLPPRDARAAYLRLPKQLKLEGTAGQVSIPLRVLKRSERGIVTYHLLPGQQTRLTPGEAYKGVITTTIEYL